MLLQLPTSKNGIMIEPYALQQGPEDVESTSLTRINLIDVKCQPMTRAAWQNKRSAVSALSYFLQVVRARCTNHQCTRAIATQHLWNEPEWTACGVATQRSSSISTAPDLKNSFYNRCLVVCSTAGEAH